MRSPWRLIRRSAWRILKLLLKVPDAAGADVKTFADPRGRPAGFTIQWIDDEPGLLRGGIKTFELDGMPFRMFFVDELDEVQRPHRRGSFYEAEELRAIGAACRAGVFVDVGANVGNHSIYAARVLGAPVIAFEPQPLAAEVLTVNALLNGCPERVEVRVEGLSDRPGNARPVERYGKSLGAIRVEPDPAGALRLVVGDDALAEVQVGFVKIDTEGAEMEVLSGLAATIARCRPPLFVEVENENLERFERFCTSSGYRVTAQFRRHDSCINLLAVPE